MRAFEADGGGSLGHVPAILLELSEDEFALVGAAGFVERAVGLVSAFDHAAEKFGWKVVGLDAYLRTDDDQALNEVTQFANVAGPGVTEEDFERAVTEFARFLAVAGAEFIEEMTSENGNVSGAIPQRRNEKRNDVQTVKKILAETAVSDFLFEIFVGSGNDAGVDAGGLIGADRFESLLFQYPQDFRLSAKTHIANFIEEKRATIGLLKLADLVVHGAGEADLDVAEELGLDEFFRNCRAVDLYEWTFIAQAGRVQGTRDEFFARAAFPENQNAAVGGGGDGDLLAQRLHGNAFADDLMAMAEFGAQGLVFFFKATLLHGVANQNDNFFQAQWLLDKVEGAEFGGADRGVDGGVAGDHDDRGGMGHGLDARERFKTVHAG